MLKCEASVPLSNILLLYSQNVLPPTQHCSFAVWVTTHDSANDLVVIADVAVGYLKSVAAALPAHDT